MRTLRDIRIEWCREYGEKKNTLFNNNQEQKINTMSKGEISEVGDMDDNMSIVAFSSYQITNNFHHLRKIKLSACKAVEVVFEINRDLVTIQQHEPLLLPYLEYLHINLIATLTHVWKCGNWNKLFNLHKHQSQSSFQNLKTLRLNHCKSIKYVFSPLMMKLVSNLKEVQVESCEGMEEIVSNRDDEDEEMMTSTTLLPHLDPLSLKFMKNLKHIGGGVSKGTTNVIHGSNFSQVDVLSSSLYPREIQIMGCDALSSVIPSSTAGRMQKLQVLNISLCGSIMEVFETNEIDKISGCSSSTAPTIPRPRNIAMHKLPNLKILKINGCELLENIFMFSTLESLKKLEMLRIECCNAKKVTVKGDFGEQTTSSSKDVVFPLLKSIELEHLPNLAGFFLGINIDFQWPLLEYVMIKDCPQMMTFTSGVSAAPRLEYINTELGKHNLEYGLTFHVTPTLHQTPPSSLDGINSGPTVSEGRIWSFHNLIELNMINDMMLEKIIPSNELQQMQKLETIYVENCFFVEDVFEVALKVTHSEYQSIVKFPKLREAELRYLDNLKHIWKSNQWTALEFPNLSIYECKSLEHVFTCSMVGGLMQLQELHIEQCENLEVVVKDEEDCDVKDNEIMFPRLKSLKLYNLTSRKGFCLGKENFSLPSLDTLAIMRCPEIMVFTQGRSIAPKLRVGETNSDSFNVGEDINSFIVTKKQEGYQVGEFLKKDRV
ncbi:hypothetical protein L1987_46155 [Smallanthus sonchifolius]|uniref:Uncharacterized protein n=1 Tax=Smallanthus sonchifolius TaxID=185202 RepID=A0ACB9FZH8_9ASTR|nr:hypothetical protein L1987_46155 [Smallanthus sonchifolius]